MFPIRSRQERGWAARYAMAVVFVTATALVRLCLEPVTSQRIPFSLFLPAIIIVSYRCGAGPCLFAIGLSLLAGDWLFVEPRHSLWIGSSEGWLELSLFVILGLTMCCVGHASRVAQQKLQKSLNESGSLRKEYQTLFELSAVGQAQVDAKTGRFVRVNSRFCEATGYTPEELSRLTFIELTHVDDREAVRDAAERLIKGELPMIELEKRCRCKSGETIDALVSAALKQESSNEPQQLVAAIRDITQQKRAERALRHAQERLERVLAERTFELQQDLRRFEGFCSSIAHDLRSPLRAMHAFSTLLNKRYGGQLPSEGKLFTERIADASARMDRLLMDLLEYGRVSCGHFEIQNINTEELVGKLVEKVRQSPMGREAQIKTEAPLPLLKANESLLAQAIENLLDNGLKFAAATSKKPRICIRAEEDGNKARIYVEDNGPGIPKQYQHLIFGVFQRLDQSDRRSTGIGLAIVRTAVERMKGSVGVDSAPGTGSRFWIELPKG